MRQLWDSIHRIRGMALISLVWVLTFLVLFYSIDTGLGKSTLAEETEETGPDTAARITTEQDDTDSDILGILVLFIVLLFFGFMVFGSFGPLDDEEDRRDRITLANCPTWVKSTILREQGDGRLLSIKRTRRSTSSSIYTVKIQDVAVVWVLKIDHSGKLLSRKMAPDTQQQVDRWQSAQFPVTIRCRHCSVQARVHAPGLFRCYNCKTTDEIDRHGLFVNTTDRHSRNREPGSQEHKTNRALAKFPFLSQCRYCSVKFKLKRAGKFRCYNCHKIDEIDQYGVLSNYKDLSKQEKMQEQIQDHQAQGLSEILSPFPVIIQCRYCSEKARVRKAGKFRCPSCQKIDEIDRFGQFINSEEKGSDDSSLLAVFLSEMRLKQEDMVTNQQYLCEELESFLSTTEEPGELLRLYLVMKQLSYRLYPGGEWLRDLFHNHRDKLSFNSYFEMPESTARVLEEWDLPAEFQGVVHLDHQRSEVLRRITDSARGGENFVIIGAPGVGKTALLFEVFHRLMTNGNAAVLTSELPGSYHETMDIRLFYDDIPQNLKLVEGIMKKGCSGLVVSAREEEWRQLPWEFQRLFTRLTIKGFDHRDLETLAQGLFELCGIQTEKDALTLMVGYALGSPMYVWTMILEMEIKDVRHLTLDFVRKNAATGIHSYIINILQELIREGHNYRFGGFHSFVLLYILANHFEGRRCHSLIFSTISRELSDRATDSLDCKQNADLQRKVLAYLSIKGDLMRFPHDSWADVVQGKGPRNPFNGDLPFIKQEFVDSGIIEEIKEKALETSWKFLLERYQRNPRIERDSFLGFCQNVLNNFTISELEGRGIDLEQMREIANMYSHLPVAEKSLAKIERIRPSTTHKVINIVDSVVIRSRIG